MTDTSVRVYSAVEDTPRRSSVIDLGDVRTKIGVGLMGSGLALIVVTWLQVRSIQNTAAQVPYIVSGGLLGVACVVVGGIALLASEVRLAAREREELERMAALLEQVAATTLWTADGIEQIAGYLNEQNTAPASTSR
jgi:hypothetical protein